MLFSEKVSPFCEHGSLFLAEKCVVIGIIGLLIGILRPSLNKARRSAQIVACASNERQIMQMMQLYATEQKGWLPTFSMAANGYTLLRQRKQLHQSLLGCHPASNPLS